MGKKHWPALLLVLALPLCSAPLELRNNPSQFCFDAYTLDTGFPSSMVFDILQTQDGFIWLATWSGLVAFDGIQFHQFSSRTHPVFQNNQLMALHEDRQGRLWIATWGGGLLCLDKGKFQLWTTAEGLASNKVRCLSGDGRGGLWAGTENGLSVFRDGKWRSYSTADGLAGNDVKALCMDGDGALWIGTMSGISRLEGEQILSYTTRQGLPSDEVFSILADQRGNLMAGTGSGVARLQGSRFVPEPGTAGLSGKAVRKLCLDKDRTLWIGTNSGLFLLRGGILQRVGFRSLKDFFVPAILEDRQGNLWVGTGSGTIEDGVFRIRPGRFTTYDRSVGLVDEMIWSILELETNKMLFGTTKGTYIFDEGTIRTWPENSILKNEAIPSLFRDREGRTWIGTHNGLRMFAGGEMEERIDLPEHHVNAIVEDENGVLWVGTDKGLYYGMGGEKKSWQAVEGLKGKRIFSIGLEAGNLVWACTEDSGLVGISQGKVERMIGKSQGLCSNRVYCVHADKAGDLWIGTDEGLNWVTDQRIRSFSSRDGLPADMVYTLLEDLTGNFWISSDNGIYSVAKGDLALYAAGKIPRVNVLHYTELDGLKSLICNGGGQDVAARSRSGQFWFATTRGVAVVDPDKGRDMAPPRIFIHEVKIDERMEVSFIDPLPKKLLVSPGSKRFEFRFTALPYARSNRMRFQYRLDGFDKSWEYAGQQRTAVYTNIPPGHYAFRVKASNEDGIWNEKGALLRFELKAFLYQRAWFKISALFLFAVAFSMAIQFIRRYVRAMKFWRRRHFVSHYRILESIGSGGMGTVYRARDTVYPFREVALKVLRDTDFANEDQKRRFKKESMIIEKLDHSHVVKIYEKGEQEDVLYLAMEYLKGETLSDMLQRKKCLDLPLGMHVMIQLSDVIVRIHQKGIVHRDLKPHNIMLIRRENNPYFVKLLDFGVAFDHHQSRMTESGVILGTLRYLPPETIQEGVVSAPGDIYSLGVIFYEMLTGFRPFSGETTVDILTQIMKFQAEAPQHLRQEIPLPLGALIMEMIDRSPDRRPSSIQVNERLKQIQSTHDLFLGVAAGMN